jgi:D-alanine-D-alanine ligase
MIEKQISSISSNLKVGIIYNFPVMPSKGVSIDYIADAEVEEEVDIIEDALKKLNLKFQRLPLKNDVEPLIKSIKQFNPDVIINTCEGAYGDSHLEMTVASLLELLRLPYTGCPPLSLGLCQNKGLSKDIMNAEGISTPKYRIVKNYEDYRGELTYPLFVKPLSEDGSIGITKDSYVENNTELKQQIEYISKFYEQPALVEEFVNGRELNISIMGGEDPKVLPISEIIFKDFKGPKIVDYSAKWLKETEEYKNTVSDCPAKLGPEVTSTLKKIALKTFSTFLCRDYARVDIRLRGDTPYVLEVNPNPDISIDGGFVRSLKAAGIRYEDFIKVILLSALKRSQAEKTPV